MSHQVKRRSAPLGKAGAGEQSPRRTETLREKLLKMTGNGGTECVTLSLTFWPDGDMTGFGDMLDIWEAFLNEEELRALITVLEGLRPAFRPKCSDDLAGGQGDVGPGRVGDQSSLAVA